VTFDPAPIPDLTKDGAAARLGEQIADHKKWEDNYFRAAHVICMGAFMESEARPQ